MNDTELNKATVIKYLDFLKRLVDDILMNEVVRGEDLRQLQIEHELFVRRIDESRWVSQELKERVNSLAGDSDVFEEGIWAKFATWMGYGVEDRDEDGRVITTTGIHLALTAYRDDLQNLLASIDSYRFWR